MDASLKVETVPLGGRYDNNREMVFFLGCHDIEVRGYRGWSNMLIERR